MALKLIPKFSYGSGPTVLTLTIPQKHPTSGSKADVGGQARAASGVAEAYYVLWEEWQRATIRFTDAEYTSVQTWWRTVARDPGSTFSYWPDKDGSAFTVYLGEPEMTEGFEPTRMADFPWVWEFTFLVRASDNATPLTTAIP